MFDYWCMKGNLWSIVILCSIVDDNIFDILMNNWKDSWALKRISLGIWIIELMLKDVNSELKEDMRKTLSIFFYGKYNLWGQKFPGWGEGKT